MRGVEGGAVQRVALRFVALVAVLAACTPSSPIADSYSRTTASGWGAAERGGNWSTSPATAFAVGGGVGRILGSAANTSYTATLPGLGRDTDTMATFAINKVATGSGPVVQVLTRLQPGGESYRARLRYAAGGEVYLAITRRSSGRDVTIGAERRLSGLSAAAGDRVRVRLTASGIHATVLRAKAWEVGASEPSGWGVATYDGTSALQRSGSTGLLYFLPSGTTNLPVTLTVDDLSVRNPAKSTPGYGAGSLGSASYPVPSGAVFVSPTGSDSASGSSSAPLRTITAATSRARSGGTIVLRGGTYRQTANWYGKRLTIQPYPRETVRLSGADVVTGWVADGGDWRKDGWTLELPQGGPSNALDPTHPLATSPDMTFVDGVPLRQVSSRSAVVTGTFYVDRANDKLFIGTNPSGRSVEASTRAWGLWVNHAHGSVIRGIGIERYATNISQVSALRAHANDVTIENSYFRQNATAALSIIGSGSIVRKNTMEHNGQLGLLVEGSSNVLVEDNRFAANNQERFRLTFAEGGAKLTHSSNVTVRGNLSERNLGRGLWVDEDSSRVRVVRNVVRDNLDRGIQYEISAQGVVASNLVVRSGSIGIYVLESNGVDVFNNTLVQSKEIKVADADRSSGNAAIPHNVADVVIRNNLTLGAAPGAQSLFTVDDIDRLRSAERLGVSANWNRYHRFSSSTPQYLVVWASYPNRIRVFRTIASFRSATGQEQNGSSSDGSSDPWFVDRNANDFRLRVGSSALRQATPLSSDVAAALGLPTGQVVDPGVL